MNINNIKRKIKEKFHVHNNDRPPYCGWKKRPASNRKDLAELFADLGYTKGAEIGVCKAIHAVQLLNTIPKLSLYCIDIWVAYNQVSQERAEARYEVAKNALKQINAIIMRMSSIKGSKEFKDSSLDFIYIDGAHDFNNVMMDLIYWTPKVRPGGMIALHDYGATCRGVQRAVDAYTFGHGIADLFMTNEMREVPSCFWVNER